MPKHPALISFLIWSILDFSAQAQSVQQAASALEDGTPVRLRLAQNVSSADAHAGDSIALEVLDEVRVANVVVVPKGATAIATVTNAQSKRSMGRAGKLDINIDYVKLVDGEKAALRAVKDVKGGGHTGAMTGAMVATSLVFFPAAPLFLFMHGKDITIPKGTEVSAFVNGNMPLDLSRFQAASSAGLPPTATAAAMGAATELSLSSTPTGAEISVDGNFVGNTPSTLALAAGQHAVSITLSGYQPWQRTLRTSGGNVNLSATLIRADRNSAVSPNSGQMSLADAARAAKARRAAVKQTQTDQSADPQN